MRQAAVRELARFRPLDEAAIHALVAAIGDASTAVSFNASLTLGRSGRSAVLPLTRYIKDESSTFRSHAVRALGRIGPEARDAVKALEVIRRDMHGGLGIEAAWALKMIATREKQDPVAPTK